MTSTQELAQTYRRAALAQQRLADILREAHSEARKLPASNDRFDLLVAITNAHTKATFAAIDYTVKAENNS